MNLDKIKNIRIEVETKKGKTLSSEIYPEDIIKLKELHNISPIEEAFNMLVDEVIRMEEK